jgi:hypothetical protein
MNEREEIDAGGNEIRRQRGGNSNKKELKGKKCCWRN